MHRPNRTHSTKYCFELKQRAKRAKADTNRGKADKVTYKDLNTFDNNKVTAALSKAKKNQKKKEKKVDNSRNEESNHKVNVLATASNNDSDSNTSHVPSKDSDSNSK
eukprot:15344002-Ditylum_brightwellii.AAC.1